MTARLPLAHRLLFSGRVHCPIGQLWKAAERRLREAETLLLQGEFHGSAYLAGYAAEIALGYCYARCTKANLAFDADTLREPARRKAKYHPSLGQAFLDAHYRQGHSPLFWWRLLELERQRIGRPLPFSNRQQIDLMVDYIQNAWDVRLRYRMDGASKVDAAEMIGRNQRVLRELTQIHAWR